MKRIALGHISTIAAAIFVIVGAAGTASAGPSSSCPNLNQLGNVKTASNVGATFVNNDNETVYWFSSLTSEGPANGVPGLVKYCVYPNPGAQPTEVDVLAKGDNGDVWKSASDPSDFMFGRPSGNKSNIGLDGTTTEMGTATWDDNPAPADQTILLHIADAGVCNSLYGGNAPTCFVLPSPSLACDKGDTSLAYNAMPFNAVNCSKPSFGVEAYDFNELGDEVTLAGTARELVSLDVSFSSYGCSVSGHWNDGTCVSSPNATFNMPSATNPITARIYAGDNCSTGGCIPGGLLATSQPQDYAIPFRPSADSSCPDPAQWFNPLKDGVGGCQYSITKVLTFTFPAGTILPDHVIWTVAYNTTSAGYTPLGALPCRTDNGGDPGCGYDSLNVGTINFIGAPYAGTDVDNGVVFLSWRQNYGGADIPLQSTTDAINPTWTGLRPLGAITVK